MKAVAEPYLSVVVVSRNDDHGRNMFNRTKSCVLGMIAQLERHKVPSELLLVEWLPPAGSPLLRDIFPWPGGLVYCKPRVIVVKPEDAPGYVYSDDYSIRDLTPWNVGIRRAKGRFVLSTVTDVLISDSMADIFAGRSLDPECIYRVDRTDVDRRVADVEGLDAQLEFSSRNIVDKHTLNPLKFILKPRLPVLHDKAPGDFILMSRERWHAIRGFPEGLNCGGDTLLLYMAHLAGARHKVLKKPARLYHIDHNSRWKTPAYLALRRALRMVRMPFWAIDIVSRIGNAFTSSKSELDRMGVRLVSSAEIQAMIEEMIDGNRPTVHNGEGWGLGASEPVSYGVGAEGR